MKTINIEKQNVYINKKPRKIPHDWQEVSLAKYGETYTGLNGKTKEDFGSGKPYIPYLNIFNNTIINDGEFDFVKINKTENQALVKNGDILFTSSSETPEEVGMCSVYDGNEAELYLNSFCFGFRPYNKDQINTNYVALLFRSPLGRRIIFKLAQGATRYNISKTNLINERFPLPPLSEQKLIAEVLNTWDKAIIDVQLKIDNLQLRKKWLMQKLLTGKVRLKRFEKEKWEIKLLEEVFIPISRPVDKPSSSFLALGIRSHGKGTFLKYDFDPNTIEMNTLFMVKENDLIVNITFAWEQAIAIVGKKDDGALVSHRFPTFTFNYQNGVVDFFRYFILQLKFKYLLDLISPGGAGRNRVLSKKDFLKIEIKIPSIEEQTAISYILQSADTEIQLLKAKKNKLQEQKKGLMQVLLSGGKRLKINN